MRCERAATAWRGAASGSCTRAWPSGATAARLPLCVPPRHVPACPVRAQRARPATAAPPGGGAGAGRRRAAGAPRRRARAPPRTARDIALSGGARPEKLIAEARRWRLAAARAARALHALDDAIAHYTRALEHDPPPQDEARILGERSELLRLSGDGPAAVRDSAAALRIARAGGNAALCDESADACADLHVLRRSATSLALVDELLARPLPDDMRCEALLVKARDQRELGQPEAAGTTLELALAATPEGEPARRAGHPRGLVRLLFERGALAEGLRLAEECKTLFERCGHRSGVARALTSIGVLSLHVGGAAEAQAALEGRASTCACAGRRRRATPWPCSTS